MNVDVASVDSERRQADRDELISQVARHCPQDGIAEAMPGLWVYRSSAPFGPICRASEAAFCLIAQGRKEVLLGQHRYSYGASQYLLSTAGLPLVSHIVDATPERPFLGVKLLLDPALVTSVLVEAAHLQPQGGASAGPLTINTWTAPLLDAAVRLLRLVGTPDDYRMLSPLIVREIVYRLLLAGREARLRQVADIGASQQRMSKAIQLIRTGYNKRLSISGLASALGMSPSGFHHHFKTATAMTPLQFQKHIRLQEARRLMVTDNHDAATAAYRVGYEDASQFSREYKRLFGEPPMRDAHRLTSHLRTSATPAS
jgi:AraC-like DNA-binding protein